MVYSRGMLIHVNTTVFAEEIKQIVTDQTAHIWLSCLCHLFQALKGLKPTPGKRQSKT